MKSNRIDESKTATINDDSVNTGLRLVNFNSTCPWSPFLFQRNWFLFKKLGNNQTFKQSRQLRACSKHSAIEFSRHDHKRRRTSRDINGFGAKRRHPTTMPASQRSKQKVEKKCRQHPWLKDVGFYSVTLVVTPWLIQLLECRKFIAQRNTRSKYCSKETTNRNNIDVFLRSTIVLHERKGT